MKKTKKMKRIFTVVAMIILCISLCLALTACGGDSDDEYESAVAEDDQDTYIDGEEDMSGAGSDVYLTGVVGDGSAMYMVGLSISSDGTQCMFAFGNPGDSLVVLCRFTDNEDGSTSLFPLDGSDQIDLFLNDNGNGAWALEVYGCEGTLNTVSEGEFMELANSLG